MKAMSERRGRVSLARAAMLAGVAAGAPVVACDAPLPTEPGDALDEAVGAEARAGLDRPPAVEPDQATSWGMALAQMNPGWVIVIDGVAPGDPTHAQRLAELGIDDIDRVEVIKGTRLLKHLYLEAMKPLGEKARGGIEISTRRGRPAAPKDR